MRAVKTEEPGIAPPPFLDVPTLLESSMPRPRVQLFWYAVGAMILFLVVGSLAAEQTPAVRQVIDLCSLVLLLCLMGATVGNTRITIGRHRRAAMAMEAVEELMQLRRWEQAAISLQGFLSEPAANQQVRVQGLVYLAAVLSRHHRFEETIAVQNYLLENQLLDEANGYGLRLGRAMAMLREDHLVDADRAMGDLRRRSGPEESAGLTLIEIYRDVKTGHPTEALQLYGEKLEMMRRQFGHRIADVHALAARAYDMLGNQAEAQAAYQRATALMPATELQRRYPEVATLAGKYQPAIAPAEAA